MMLSPMAVCVIALSIPKSKIPDDILQKASRFIAVQLVKPEFVSISFYSVYLFFNFLQLRSVKMGAKINRGKK